MNPCHGCGLDPALYINPVFGFDESVGAGFYEVECQCRRTSGRFLRSGDAVAEWNRRNPPTSSEGDAVRSLTRESGAQAEG